MVLIFLTLASIYSYTDICLALKTTTQIAKNPQQLFQICLRGGYQGLYEQVRGLKFGSTTWF